MYANELIFLCLQFVICGADNQPPAEVVTQICCLLY